MTSRARVRQGELAYERAGSGRPVVLLHAGVLDRSQWDVEFAVLAGGHDVVRLDARSHGESSTRPAGEFTSTEDLAGLLDHLGLDRVTLVGLSLGARTAIDFALRAQERVAAMLLVGPGYSGMEFSDPYVLACLAEIDRAVAARDAGALLEALLRVWVDGPHRAPEQVGVEVRARCAAMARGTLLRHAGSAGTVVEVGAGGRFGELAMPVDVVVGDLDSTDILRAAERLRGEAADARLVTVPGAGHMVNLDRPEAFGAALESFLARTA
ncbi:hydrolase [Longispora fulva]|uniref:Pimeloyl-ACP methyl ester carboxylesterase n=1 Tax=Longispora fulva TaxID=619741 RepID=A0A8J7G869_9ACTN|nr:alpha/beta hydrolase [Longispora fulva]MBG6134855.1 pimeloyl-ACP methyl ester carboxylesterase [Longispora fulva]GIG56913.1 hydrolase [Longispora fulva]